MEVAENTCATAGCGTEYILNQPDGRCDNVNHGKNDQIRGYNNNLIPPGGMSCNHLVVFRHKKFNFYIINKYHRHQAHFHIHY